MTVIRVIGEAECASVDVESDSLLPLKISWWPRGQVQPLYLRVSGSRGGELELKVHPETGALLQVIVISRPPEPARSWVSMPPPSDGESSNTPRLDVSAWGGDQGRGTDALRRPVLAIETDLTLWVSNQRALLRVSEWPAIKWIRCNGVGVGVSSEGTIVAVEADLSS